MPTFLSAVKSSKGASFWLFSCSKEFSNKALGYVRWSSFLSLYSDLSASIITSLPRSENTISPEDIFLTTSDKILALTKHSPSTIESTLSFALMTKSKSEPITSHEPSSTFIYKPWREGVDGLTSTALETDKTTSFRSFVFVLNFKLFLYIYNNNKTV